MPKDSSEGLLTCTWGSRGLTPLWGEQILLKLRHHENFNSDFPLILKWLSDLFLQTFPYFIFLHYTFIHNFSPRQLEFITGEFILTGFKISPKESSNWLFFLLFGDQILAVRPNYPPPPPPGRGIIFPSCQLSFLEIRTFAFFCPYDTTTSRYALWKSKCMQIQIQTAFH